MNKGAFHEYYNRNGGYTFSDGLKGVLTTVTVNGVADCFIPANIGTAVGHPQGLSEKYIHPHMVVDLRLEANAINPNEELLAIGSKAKSGNVAGISGVVGMLYGDTFSASTGSVDTTNSLSVYINAGVDDYILYSYGKVVAPDINVELTLKGLQGSVILVYKDSGKWKRKTGSASSEINYGLPFANGLLIDNFSCTTILPIISSGSHLTTDLIGDPANYPESMKSILASGKPLIGINPLLVGQDGTSYIPDGVILNTLSCKAMDSSTLSTLYDQDTTDGIVWLYTGNDIDNTTNIINSATPLNGIRLYSYTAKNTTTKQSDPKAVKVVGNYATATNSNSVYKGNQLVPTGKVNVGGVVESRILEKITEAGTYDFLWDDNIGLHLWDVGSSLYVSDTQAIPDVFKNKLYISLIAFTYGVVDWNNSTLDGDLVRYINGIAYYKLVSFTSVPSHNTITLDNSNSPAVKFLETIAEDADGMAHYQVFSQEMEYNATDTDYADDIATFPNLTNGTADNLLGVDRVRTIVSSIPLNQYFRRA